MNITNAVQKLTVFSLFLGFGAVLVRADHTPRAVLPDAIVDLRTSEGADAKLEKLADGFTFTEGPIWIDPGNPAIAPDSTEGFLLFSDPNNNLIYRCSIDGEVQVYKPNPVIRGKTLVNMASQGPMD